MPFQIHALPAENFAHLFDLTDAQLAEHRATRVIADEDNAFPCRVSLADAQKGETLILLNHAHIASGSPYDATHAIFVREDVATARPKINEVPPVLSRRLLSVRAFGSDNMMRTAEVLDGVDLCAQLTRYFTDPDIAYVHIHNARQGCYAAKATRAG